MACIINIETTTQVCSVALSQDGQCLMSKEDFEGPSHGVVLGPYVDEAVSFADSHAIPIDAVAVSQGPGSYTGLRIGVSTAKGLCYGRGLKLVAVPTLEVLCVPLLLYRDDLPSDALFCPMLDARRMEVYSAIYTRGLKVVKPVSADLIDENSYHDLLKEHRIVFFGNGAAKCREVIRHPNAIFINDVDPLAKYMFPLAERKFLSGQTEDVAYFEPFYLKEFVATKPRKLF